MGLVMPPIEALLSERAWLVRLSAELLDDPQGAEDLAQDTLVSGMRYGPEKPRDLRAWLAKVARNLAARRDRRERGRSSVEERAARREAQEGPDEVVERFDLHRSVANAVVTLPEPYRTTLLLRYWEELSLNTIASRMDAPRETVRTRLRRGLALLREQLDGEHGGSVGMGCSARGADRKQCRIGSECQRCTRHQIDRCGCRARDGRQHVASGGPRGFCAGVE